MKVYGKKGCDSFAAVLARPLVKQENLANKRFYSCSPLKQTTNLTSAHQSLRSPTTLNPKKRLLEEEKPIGTLAELLQECMQQEVLAFADCVPPDAVVVKIGEATFSEVFFFNNLVLKIVPLKMPGHQLSAAGICDMRPADAKKELAITKVLGSLKGFIGLKAAVVAKGKYPACLIDAWDFYKASGESLNESPSLFTVEQHFIVLQLDYGGSDLEHFTFSTYAQAVSSFLQLCHFVGAAEKQLQFEHRDLHWGNVLVQRNTNTSVVQVGEAKIRSFGAVCCLIDFSYSRILQPATGLSIFCDLSADPDLFTGDADEDYQFEVYRQMRAELGRTGWNGFFPKTNVFWLRYLAMKFVKGVSFDCGEAVKQPLTRRKYNLIMKDFLQQLQAAVSAESFIAELRSEQLDAFYC